MKTATGMGKRGRVEEIQDCEGVFFCDCKGVLILTYRWREWSVFKYRWEGANTKEILVIKKREEPVPEGSVWSGKWSLYNK